MPRYGIPPEFRGGVHLFILTAIRHRVSPELSGHAIAYRWRSQPRVHRHRASKPQRSSKRVLSWQLTMDQFKCASLSHTRYWHEVGMLKVPNTKYMVIIYNHPFRFFPRIAHNLIRLRLLVCSGFRGVPTWRYVCMYVWLSHIAEYGSTG